jgi:membrane-bound lytic murein transglycosylase D
MKTIQSKSLLTLIIIFFIIGFSTSAKNIVGLNGDFLLDSTRFDSINPKVNLEISLVKNPDWVVYPAVLQEHREESKEYVKKYSESQRSYIMYMFKRGQKYFQKAMDIFDVYNVPYELQMLPALESNFSANAVSPVGAVGYWQFMSELAQEYGLKIGGKYDQRKNFTKSTIAAAKFFRDQLEYFNDDLLLTVAAYNCGQGRVRQALKNSGKKEADFWDVKQYLPAETRRFVMKFISLNVIAANYNKFLNKKLNFNEPPLVQIASLDSSKAEYSAFRNSL